MAALEPRTANGDTRERILDAAESLFLDHGFEGTSMRMITAQAEVNLAAANYHFGSKEALIQEVFRTLSGVGSAPAPEPERPQPAVPIKKSITPGYLICLEDGKKFKSLKRHLRTHFNLTPEQYREKWGLPADYPMVAPNYANSRSKLAKNMGLGQRRGS